MFSCYCTVLFFIYVFFFKQKTAYEMRISDWSSDVCSSDLILGNGRNMLKNFQKSLLISTAIPVAFMAASAAQARDVSVPAPVAPATSVPGTTVNAAIVTAITAPDDANLKLTVPSAGVVLGDSIVLNPNTGQGDGKIDRKST